MEQLICYVDLPAALSGAIPEDEPWYAGFRDAMLGELGGLAAEDCRGGGLMAMLDKEEGAAFRLRVSWDFDGQRSERRAQAGRAAVERAIGLVPQMRGAGLNRVVWARDL